MSCRRFRHNYIIMPHVSVSVCKKKMNHGGTRPQLIKIHKYFENFLRQFRTKSRGGAWGGGGVVGQRVGELLILKEFLFSLY